MDIVHAKPEMVFISNDKSLKEFRPLFANTVGQLEQRKPSLDGEKTYNTFQAVNDMVEESYHNVDQKAYLRSRLVDFLIADFDRHDGQIRWGLTEDNSGNRLYYPIPKDRDQALYNNRGWIMKIGRRWGYSFMTNFDYNINTLYKYGLVGGYMDMYFTNSLNEEDWQMTLHEFKTKLSDDVMHNAASQLPNEIYNIRGREIEKRLKYRRDIIADKGMQYYRFISKKVNVPGGNKDELFKVSENGSGDVLVEVYRKDDDGSYSELEYSRVFDPSVTKEVRLYGFNGNDYFDIDKNVNSKIRFRIVGGKGNDTFDIKGSAKNFLYDLSFEDNYIKERRHTTKLFSHKPSVNEFKFRERIHNSVRFPLISAGFNADDGFMAGLGIRYKTYGFRKYPYASKQQINTLVAFNKKAYQARYTGEFINVFRKYDLTALGEIYNPVLNTFYGFGNETVKDEGRDIEYYRTRYSYVSADVMARKRLLNDSILSISIGPSIYNYWFDEEGNNNRVLERPSVIGLDSAGVYDHKLYAGGKFALRVNNIDDELVPMRGVSWNTELVSQKLLNQDRGGEIFTRLTSAMDVYATLIPNRRLMAAIHIGGGHIFSSNYEYFQALTLGGNNYLRGFTRNRFAGSSMLYTSAELRLKLFDFNAYLVKSDVGLVGFNDIGRVWVRNENSDKWHHGYGGGIYVIPYNSIMLSAVMGFSEEDQLFNLSLGTKIYLAY